MYTTTSFALTASLVLLDLDAVFQLQNDLLPQNQTMRIPNFNIPLIECVILPSREYHVRHVYDYIRIRPTLSILKGSSNGWNNRQHWEGQCSSNTSALAHCGSSCWEITFADKILLSGKNYGLGDLEQDWWEIYLLDTEGLRRIIHTLKKYDDIWIFKEG